MQRSTFRQAVARNIRAAREAAKLERSQVAESTGIWHATLIRIEDGDFSPRLDTLKLLAATLGTTTDALLAGAPLPPRKEPKQRSRPPSKAGGGR